MTCSLPEGIEIRFPHSGVRVRPYEGDVKRGQRNYATAEFTLSKAAGELIGNSVSTKEPVLFVIDGNPVYRFVLLEDSLEFRQNFGKEDEAVLEIYDARRVLDSGVISKTWKGARFSDIVSHILDNRQDEYGVINDVNYAGEGSPEDEVEGSELVPDYAGFSLKEFFNPLNLVGARHPFVPGIEFDEITPLQAMEKVTGELEYDFWVDVDGTLNVGLDETWGQVMAVLNKEETAVERLDIIESHNKIDTVITSAPHQGENEWFQTGALRGVAQATTDEFDGSSLALGISQGSTLEDVRRIAERRLLKETLGDINGSAVFNGLATKDKETLGKLTVGDHLYIDGNAFASCRTSVDSGHYIVKNVHHRINPRQGWRVDVDISRAIQDIESTTWFYDPQDDKRYDTIEAYRADVAGDIGLSGGL